MFFGRILLVNHHLLHVVKSMNRELIIIKEHPLFKGVLTSRDPF